MCWGGRKGPAGRMGVLPSGVHGGAAWGAPVPESGCRVWLGGGPSRERGCRGRTWPRGAGGGRRDGASLTLQGPLCVLSPEGLLGPAQRRALRVGHPKNVLGDEPKVCSVLSRCSGRQGAGCPCGRGPSSLLCPWDWALPVLPASPGVRRMTVVLGLALLLGLGSRHAARVCGRVCGSFPLLLGCSLCRRPCESPASGPCPARQHGPQGHDSPARPLRRWPSP